jgi:hypothetical protein
MADVNWDPVAEQIFMTAVAARLLPQITQDVFAIAESIAPVKARPASYSGGPLPGLLKESVRWEVGLDPIGPYGIVAALWYGRFLDPKARQLRHLYPFLPSSLYMGVQGKVYYLD